MCSVAKKKRNQTALVGGRRRRFLLLYNNISSKHCKARGMHLLSAPTTTTTTSIHPNEAHRERDIEIDERRKYKHRGVIVSAA
jgi:hypothetical protein